MARTLTRMNRMARSMTGMARTLARIVTRMPRTVTRMARWLAHLYDLSYGPEKANYGTASFAFKKEKCAARSRSLAERLVKFLETCEWNITTSTFVFLKVEVKVGHFLF